MRKSCVGCRYYKHLGTQPGINDKACHYTLETGKLRPCPADKCTVKEEAVSRWHPKRYVYGGGHK